MVNMIKIVLFILYVFVMSKCPIYTIDNVEQRTSNGNFSNIHLNDVRSITRKSDVIVAIIDTGFDLTHPALKKYLYPGISIISPGEKPQDENGHGTRIAGVVVQIGNYLGEGSEFKTKIMPIKAVYKNGTTSIEEVVKAIHYAVDNGADLINVSLEFYRVTPDVREAVQYAEDNGVLIVASAGNRGSSVAYPAAFPTVLAVGSETDNTVELYSNHGDSIDLVAPSSYDTTIIGGGHLVHRGTSISAPQVTGVVSLLLSQYPKLQPVQLRNLICYATEDIESPGWDQYSGYGLLRADKALNPSNIKNFLK